MHGTRVVTIFQWVYLAKGIAYLAVAFITFYIFYITRERKFCRVGPLSGLVGILSLIMGMVNIAWCTGYLMPTSSDSVAIGSIYAICLAILISLIAYKITENRLVIYLLGLFIVALLLVFLRSKSLVYVSLIAYILLFILFFDIAIFHIGVLKKAGYFGIAHAITAIFLVYQVIWGRPADVRWWFIPLIFLFFVFYYVLQHAKRCEQRLHFTARNEPPFVRCLKLCIFTALFTVFIFFSASLIHEFGHVLALKVYGCTYESITYVPGIFSYEAYTTGICESGSTAVMAIGGLALTTLVGLIFYLTSGAFSSYLGYLVIGFGVLMANKDLLFLGLSNTLIFIINFFGVLVILSAIVKVVHLYAVKEREEKTLYCGEKTASAKGQRCKPDKPDNRIKIIEY